MKKISKKMLLFFVILIISCNDVDTTKEDQKTRCELAIKKIERCLNLNENSLSYIDKCGSEEVTIIESIRDCNDLIDYIKGN